MATRPACLLLLLSLFAAPASAEVVQSEPANILIRQRLIVATDAATSFDGLLHIERWWSGEHTYSGDASKLSLAAQAGGCWCERWPGGEIEHGRVIYLKPDSQLRILGALGPLQELAVTGVLDFTLLQGKDGTQIDLSYRVNGSPASALDGVAAVVDQVLAEQLGRLKAHLDPLAPNAVAP